NDYCRPCHVHDEECDVCNDDRFENVERAGCQTVNQRQRCREADCRDKCRPRTGMEPADRRACYPSECGHTKECNRSINVIVGRLNWPQLTRRGLHATNPISRRKYCHSFEASPTANEGTPRSE